MEYLIGSFVTIVGIAILYSSLKFIESKERPLRLRVSQSRNHHTFSPILLNIDYRPPRETQSILHREKSQTKILFTDNKAYWIKNNAVFAADLDPMTGLILENSAKEVDIIGMDKVELNEMMFIVEKLTEGRTNDNWGTGN